ncbi:MAG TPA: carboxypeptidase-like regulatory domain-containing protein [Acidobacteriaceae bacterium]|nr:carboxypeptidase-like regulatory domain-containing protein [Acidobacteriaceae bacterium]
MKRVRGFGAVLFLACMCVVSLPVKAQTVYGGIAGLVLDNVGAAVPGAKIEAINEKTGVKFQTVATSAGIYRFPELPLGSYTVNATSPGFQQSSSTGVRVDVQITTSLNIKLTLGAVAQTVTVNASGPHLETQTSDINGSVTDQEYLQLPLTLGGVGAFRSPEAFEFLLPGTTGPGTANNNSNGIFFARIAGGQAFGNEVLIDGLSQQRSENGSSFDEEAPSVEALNELTVTQAMPPAEYSRTTGGIENFVTKSGTNQYHGDVYDLVRNTALDANLWFNGGYKALTCTGANNTPACRSTFATPVDRKNDYGVTLGGPVWIPKVYNGRDKLFFFFSWEQLRYNLGATTQTTVPTAQEKAGDFSNPAIFQTNKVLGTNPCDGTPIYQGQIFDPTTTRVVALGNGSSIPCRTAFPGNKIPLNRFSSVARTLMGYFPAPTNNQVFNNFSFASASPITNTTDTIRIDANITQKSKLWSSYSSRDNNRIAGTPQILPYPIDPNTWKQDFETHFWRIGWDYSFTPTVLNNFIFGSNRSNSKNFAVPILTGTDWMKRLGVGNAVSNNFPVIDNGFTDQEGMPNNGDNVDNGLRLDESVAWEKGAHNVTVGVDLRYQQYSPINGNSPQIGFCTGQTAADPNQPLSGNGLASELLGDACGGSQNIYYHQSRWISWYYSGFVQDNWQVNQQLTLNLGLNYSVDVPRHEALNDTSNFSKTAIDPEYNVPGALVFGTKCHGCNTAWADTWYKDLGPRLGFAYTPAFLDNKTVLRGGGGILYGPLQYDDFGGAMDAGYKSNPTFPSKNGFDPSFQIDNGYPAFKQPPDLDPGQFNGSYLPGSYIERRAGRPAMISNFDLQVQQQLAHDLVMTVGWTGSVGQNLQANVQNINNIGLNQISLGDELSSPLRGNNYGVKEPFPGYFKLWGDGVQVQQALRPFPQYDFIDSGCCLENPGHSSYNALMATLAHQFKNGVELQVSYTWSKNITDADSILPNTNPGIPQVQNPADLHQEKSISIQDIPQTLVISYLYDLPFGRNKQFLNSGRLLDALVGGWEIGGIQRYQDGQPLGFCCASGIPGWENAIRYNRVPGSHIASAAYRRGGQNALNPFAIGSGTNPELNSMFNGAVNNPAYATNPAAPAFVDQNLEIYRHGGAYHLGDTPRVTGTVRTPPYYEEDFSLMKSVIIRGTTNFELKFDILNALNRHSFGTPDSNPNDFLFGVPTFSQEAPRAIQVTGKVNF